MSDRLDLFITGTGRTDLLRHQARLCEKNLLDEHGLCLIDNSPRQHAGSMEGACRNLGTVGYIRCPDPKREHFSALDLALAEATRIGSRFFGFLDHDIFPITQTRIIPVLDEVGFFGLGQTDPRGRHYLWPGLCFFSADWLDGREFSFVGTRDRQPKFNGDTGSGMWRLFSTEDWQRLPLLKHGYRELRPDDGYGTQSNSVELIGDWIHLMNGSNWLKVPRPDERQRLCLQLLESY